MVERKKQKRQKKHPPTTARRTTDKSASSSSSSPIIDPTALTEDEESELKEAIKKAMIDEKGHNKGYFTIGEVTSPLIMLPQTSWTESKVDRVILEWYEKGKLKEQHGIGKYTPI